MIALFTSFCCSAEFDIPGNALDVLVSDTEFSFVQEYPQKNTASFTDKELTLNFVKSETPSEIYFIHSLMPRETKLNIIINIKGKAKLIFTSQWTDEQFNAVTINKESGEIEVIRHPTSEIPSGTYSYCISFLEDYCPQNVKSASYVNAENFMITYKTTHKYLVMGRDLYDPTILPLNIKNVDFNFELIGPENAKVPPHVEINLEKSLKLSFERIGFRINEPVQEKLLLYNCSVLSPELKVKEVIIDPQTLSTFKFLYAYKTYVSEALIDQPEYAEIRALEKKSTVQLRRHEHYSYFKIQDGLVGISNNVEKEKTIWINQDNMLDLGIATPPLRKQLTVIKDNTNLKIHCHYLASYPSTIIVDCDLMPFIIRRENDSPVTFILKRAYTTMTHFEATEIVLDTPLKEPVLLDGKLSNFNNTKFTFKSQYISLAVGIFGNDIFGTPFTANLIVGKDSISTISFGSFLSIQKHITVNAKFDYEFKDNVNDEEMRKVMSKNWEIIKVNISAEGLLEKGTFTFPNTQLHGFIEGNRVFDVWQVAETSGFAWSWIKSLAELPMLYTTGDAKPGAVKVKEEEITNIIQNTPNGVKIAHFDTLTPIKVTFDGTTLNQILFTSTPSVQHSFNGKLSIKSLKLNGVSVTTETGLILATQSLTFDDKVSFVGNIKIENAPNYEGPIEPFKGVLSGSALGEVSIKDFISVIKFRNKERTFSIENVKGSSADMTTKTITILASQRLSVAADEGAVIDLNSVNIEINDKLDFVIINTNGKFPEIVGKLKHATKENLLVYSDNYGKVPQIADFTYPIIIQNAKSKIEMGNNEYDKNNQFSIRFDEETSTSKTLSYNEITLKENAMEQPYPQSGIIIEADKALVSCLYDVKMKVNKNLVIDRRIKEYVVDVSESVDLEIRFDSSNMPRLTIENPPKKAVWVVDDTAQEMEEYSRFFSIDKIIIDGLDHSECLSMLAKSSMESELSAYNSSKKEQFVLAFWCEKYTSENSRLYVGLKGHLPPDPTTAARTPHQTPNPEEADSTDNFVKYTIGGGIFLIVVLLVCTIIYKKCAHRQAIKDDAFFSTESIGNFSTENPLGVDHFID